MTKRSATYGTWVVLAGLVVATACSALRRRAESPQGRAEGPQTPPAKADAEGWASLFDGKTLEGWKVLDQDSFVGHGQVEAKDGAIQIKRGQPMSAILWTGDIPKENFEVELEALRKEGGADIFCGLTVPVGEGRVSLVLGGWGDSVVGLSAINDQFANENESTKNMSFKNEKWYQVSLRVTPAKVEAWIDGEKVVDVPRADRKFSLHPMVDTIRGLGIFTYDCDASLRALRVRSVKP